MEVDGMLCEIMADRSCVNMEHFFEIDSKISLIC